MRGIISSRNLYLSRWWLLWTAAIPSLAFQSLEAPKSALERRGLHHSSIHGRFVSPEGKPSPGVHVQLSAGGPRALPGRDAVTDSAGNFTLPDVNTSYVPDLRWYPPVGWMSGETFLAGASGEDIDVGTIHLKFPETAAVPDRVEREFQATGRILAPDGANVEGVFVAIRDFGLARTFPQWTTTDSEGRFQLKYRAAECNEPKFSHAGSDYWNRILLLEKESKDCGERWAKPKDIVMPFATRLVFQADGAGDAAVRAFWWHDSFGWQPFSSLQPWISLSSLGRNHEVKVEADGFLPIAQALDLPYIIGLNDHKPPAAVTVRVRLNPAVQRSLVVMSGGKKLPGAIVDVEQIQNLESDSRRLLGAYRTSADGSLILRGGGGDLIEVFAYAPGFEPCRAIWNPGQFLRLDLTPRDATLSFTSQTPAAIARVRRADDPNALRTFDLGVSHDVKLAGGIYDVTSYLKPGEVLGYQRVSLAAGQTLRVDPSVDQRPRLTIRYPAGGWRATVSESIPRGAAVSWTATIPVGSPVTFSDTPATIESQTATQAVFLLSHAGSMHIELRRDRQTLSLWRDVTLRPGEAVAVDLSEATASLKGSMRTYKGGLIPSDHGFAGPRIQLISDDPGGWSVTDYIPRRDGRSGRFTMQGIPAGAYHVYQHLIAGSVPIAAWGGIPVKLESGATSQLQDFIDYPYRDLRVRVTDRDGRALDHATIRIRDRMSDSWRQIQENPSQIEQAAHPIPYPAAARLKNGEAVLPRVRTGWLELCVELDQGASYAFRAPVSSGKILNLTVPVDSAQSPVPAGRGLNNGRPASDK